MVCGQCAIKMHFRCKFNKSNLIRRWPIIKFLSFSFFVSKSFSNTHVCKRQNFHKFIYLILLSNHFQIIIFTNWMNIFVNLILFVNNMIIVVITFPCVILSIRVDKIAWVHLSFHFKKSFVFIFALFGNRFFKFRFITVKFISNKHIPKIHNISSKRSCFIWKYVSDLSQIFYNTGGLNIDKLLTLPTKHQSILWDEISLDHFANFKSYLQWNWQ